MSAQTKIEWCDATVNVAWHCHNNDCPYCAARRIAKLRAEYVGKKRGYSPDLIAKMKRFESGLFPDWKKIIEKTCKTRKSKRIFFSFMGDIYYFSREMLYQIFDEFGKYPQHTYLFLTKYPRIYVDELELFARKDIKKLTGMTVTCNADYLECYTRYTGLFQTGYFDFISLEPLVEDINPEWLRFFKWVIIGSETGNRKGKVVPEYDWIDKIVQYCISNRIPVFCKDNLKEVYPSYFLYQEFPK
ncbi:MAG: DUF5131 family protein [Candidatus Aminicenantes bacterium]|nr:DUF5131 family protein [Candidatus Aminicenantes bacterium]